MADVQRTRHGRRRGVDGEDARAVAPTGRRRRCRPPPTGPTTWPRGPPERARSGTSGCRGRSSGQALGECVVAVVVHGRGYRTRSAAPSRHRHRRGPSPSTCGSRAACRCTSAASTVYDVPHLGHGRLAAGLRRAAAVPRVLGASRSATSPTSPTSTTRSSPGPPTEGRHRGRGRRGVRGGVVGGHGRAGVKRPTETPHATAYVDATWSS